MKKVILLLLCCVMSMLMACDNGTPKADGNPKASAEAEIMVNELTGKWERRSAEGIYTLYLMSDGTGKVVSYEHTSAATYKFEYKVTDKGVVVDWDKLKRETYHAVLTVDGKYLVLDNGANVFVYKKREK